MKLLNEDVIYNELFEIWAERIKTKKYTLEAFEFERNAGAVMMYEARMLANLTWHNQGFDKFKIHHPEREINAPLYPDRIAEAWIVEKYIKPFVQPKVLETNMACQAGKGMYKAMHMLKAVLSECYQKYGYDFYFFQYDMQGYYDNLSHDVIKNQFSDLSFEGQRLLSNIVDGWKCPDCYAVENRGASGDFGVPKGCLPSQWMGIFYLNELDHLIDSMPECLFFIRYMDDAVMIFRRKEECKRVKELIAEYLFLHQMGIRLHPRKTNYAPINRGFNFCGWHYDVKPSGKILMHIKQSKKKEMMGKLRYIQGCYERGEKSWIEVRDVVRGICNYLSWGDTYHLRKYICNRFTFRRKSDNELCDMMAQSKLFLNETAYYDDLADSYIMGKNVCFNLIDGRNEDEK